MYLNNFNIKNLLAQKVWVKTGFFRCSAKKVNLVGRLISGLPLAEAIKQLEFCDKKSAPILLKNLKYGRHLAKERKMDVKKVFVSKFYL